MTYMENVDFDYIVIGAGPAGLASAQYAARSGIKTVVLDMAGAGGQVLQIMDLENYPGVYPSVNGADFMENMKKQAESFGVTIEIATVSSIDKRNQKFYVQTKSKLYSAPYLSIATGAVHRNLNVPGEKELTGRGVSYCAVCDGPFFRNKKIVVVGGGDSACSEAVYLASLSDKVTIVHRRDSFRAQKSLIDKMLGAGVQPVYNSVVKSINGSVKVESVTVENDKHEVTDIPADAVFVFTGMIPQTTLVEMIPKDDAGYIKTDENMETLIPGLFAIGDVRSKGFRQIVTAVSDGAIAAHTISEKMRLGRDEKNEL